MTIQRYTFGVLQPDPDSERGEWVRWEDVQRLLSTCREIIDDASQSEWADMRIVDARLLERLEELVVDTKGTP